MNEMNAIYCLKVVQTIHRLVVKNGHEDNQMTIERFETHPDAYRHWQLSIDGAVARLEMNIQEEDGNDKNYILKLNSYDIFVDIELADAVNRLRFEHPEVKAVIVTMVSRSRHQCFLHPDGRKSFRYFFLKIQIEILKI